MTARKPQIEFLKWIFFKNASKFWVKSINVGLTSKIFEVFQIWFHVLIQCPSAPQKSVLKFELAHTWWIWHQVLEISANWKDNGHPLYQKTKFFIARKRIAFCTDSLQEKVIFRSHLFLYPKGLKIQLCGLWARKHSDWDWESVTGRRGSV